MIHPRVAKAMNAMKAIGIPPETVKPVLKRLLKAYDDNWELIEDENYRVLADAIFECVDSEETECKASPTTRCHLKEKEDQAPPSTCTSLSMPFVESTMKRQNMNRPVSPHIRLGEKRPLPERSSIKSLKVAKHVQHQNDSLVKPKSEPLAIEFPREKTPIAVIRPPLSMMKKAHMNQENHHGILSSNNSARSGNQDNVDIPEAMCQSGTEIEVASTTFGEIKLYLQCDSAVLSQADFHAPDLDSVLKLVEDNCIRSYRIPEPSFSMKKLMKELCRRFLQMGVGPNKGTHKTFVTPQDSMKRYKLKDIAGSSNDYKFNSPTSKVSCGINIERDPKPLALTKSDGHIHCSQHSQTVHMTSNFERDKKIRTETSNSSMNAFSLVPINKQQFSFDDIKPLHDVEDIAKGQENFKISVVNEVSSVQYPSSFHYISHNTVYQNAYISFSLARIGDENCCSGCFGDCLSSSIPCACARETGGEYAYTQDGLLRKEFLDECVSLNYDPQKNRLFYCNDCPLERTKNEVQPEPCKGHLVRKFVKECWNKCGCNMQCGNRVVQRGITHKLQVFLVAGDKGWGVRSLEILQRGTFVCEYVGEILTNMELYDRTLHETVNDRHTYPVLLDADWGSEGVLKDEEALCLDATFHGNVARFINHRCFDATLIGIPVEVESPDHHYYHLAFFTTRKVEALEELTWDYGIDFDDHNHPVKAFKCCCGSKYCRDRKPLKS